MRSAAHQSSPAIGPAFQEVWIPVCCALAIFPIVIKHGCGAELSVFATNFALQPGMITFAQVAGVPILYLEQI